MKLSLKGVHSIELNEFYRNPSFAFVGLLPGRILSGLTKIHRILWFFQFFGRVDGSFGKTN